MRNYNKLIKPSRYTEAAGWYGMSALILAYGLASFGIIPAEGVIFQLMNLTGAIGLMIVAASKQVLQSVLLNLFWAIIGMVAFLRALI